MARRSRAERPRHADHPPEAVAVCGANRALAPAQLARKTASFAEAAVAVWAIWSLVSADQVFPRQYFFVDLPSTLGRRRHGKAGIFVRRQRRIRRRHHWSGATASFRPRRLGPCRRVLHESFAALGSRRRRGRRLRRQGIAGAVFGELPGLGRLASRYARRRRRARPEVEITSHCLCRRTQLRISDLSGGAIIACVQGARACATSIGVCSAGPGPWPSFFR